MATAGKTKIFLSYSHVDERWKDRLAAHLSILESEQQLDVWTDVHISAGDSWEEEIQRTLDQVSIAVLLVTAEFLSSKYIIDNEIPRLLARRSSEGLVILPVIVRPCDWQAVAWLRELQVLPRDGRPLSRLSPEEVDEALASLAIEIRAILRARSVRQEAERLEGPIDHERVGAGSVFVCHCEEDGDFAALVKNEVEKAELRAWIDTDRLIVGVNWREEIDQAIRSSIALIVVMTPEARKSEYVTYEWSFAFGVGVPVIPVLLRQTQLHPRLEAMQYLDFTNRRARPWGDLIEAIKGLDALGDAGHTPNTGVAADVWRRR